MRFSITFADSGRNGVTVTTNAEDVPRDTGEAATPAAIMAITTLALFDCRGLEILGHHVLKGMAEGKTPTESLKPILERLDDNDTEQR